MTPTTNPEATEFDRTTALTPIEGRSGANQTLDGVESGAHEVLADESSRMVRAALSADITAL